MAMPDPACSDPRCIHKPGFVIACGYDLDLALHSVGPGWDDLVREGFAHIEGYGRIVQVKEKFGTLCLYAAPFAETSPERREQMWAALYAIESRSALICETCGAPGKITGEYWFRTACPEHAERSGAIDGSTPSIPEP